MTKFIRIKTINNLDVMIRASAIFTITKAEVAKHTYIVTEDACGNREQFIVEHTMDEIQAMIQGEPPKPVAEQSPEPEACDDPIARKVQEHVDLTKDRPTSIREALQQITDAEEKQPQTKQSLTDAVLHMMKSSRQSRYAISQKSGISQAVLSRFVNGERLLGMRTLERLAEALGHRIVLVSEAKETT